MPWLISLLIITKIAKDGSLVLTSLYSYSIVLSYSFAMGYPLGSYMEYPFLVLQGMYKLILGYY